DSARKSDTTNSSNISAAPGTQWEGTIAVDPNNASRVFAASNAEGSGGLFAAYSSDRGVIWQPSDPNDHLIADGSNPADKLPVALGHPKAVFDRFGNLFLTYLAKDENTIVVALSTDGGASFQALPVFADAPQGSVPGTFSVNQPSIAVGSLDDG